MSVEQASFVVMTLGLYALAGAVFAVAFVAGLANRIDPDFKSASTPARMLIVWGAGALWPLLLVRVILGSRAA